MKKIFTMFALLVCMAAGIFILGPRAQADDDFFEDAAEIGLAEVALSNLALQRAQSTAVRDFARQMVADHTATNQELMSLAATKNVKLPTTLSTKHQRALSKLTSASATDFDRQYMRQMVEDHEKAVSLFRKNAEKNSDTDAKAFAAKNLPALQQHLAMARTLHTGTSSGGHGSVNGVHNMNMNHNGNMNHNVNTNGNNNRSNSNANRGNSNGSNRNSVNNNVNGPL